MYCGLRLAVLRFVAERLHALLRVLPGLLRASHVDVSCRARPISARMFTRSGSTSQKPQKQVR